ncbi:MAG: penicillin-binding protein 2 [Prevotella sp.]|nr:penicillin-binding protein 2 [Prevotella sp.]MBO5314635.1 penicillin-binding protein 2 [Prevotella sp.]
MRSGYEFEYRKFVIGGVAILIVIIYLIRLFTLQIMSDDYKKNADSNALLKKVEYPARGIITDRNGKLLVYNQHAYDVMVVMNEQKDRIDTLDFCETLGITPDFFKERMAEIKDRNKNPGYSRYTQQLFLSQLSNEEFSVFQEKIYRFPGFYVRRRSIRQYTMPYAAHVLGDVAEVSQGDIDNDDYYQRGDYIGKQGVEKSYEDVLRGEKGMQILLRDVQGRIQGKYQNGAFDKRPVAGKDLTLSIDIELQALGERLMEGKIGSIVAIEPATGEILCMVSSPTFDPRDMVGRNRGKMHSQLALNPQKPLLNRSVMGQYPPGSTFKTSQALTFFTEGIITPYTAYPCHRGFYHRGLKVGCHGHASPASIVPAISTSCNAYFCWGLYYMLSNRSKYKTVQESMNIWRDYMVSMGFGYKLGVDLPGEKRGLIPNAEYYDKHYNKSWNGLTVISISIGQGEVNLTPLQIANLGATIANRGYYYTPHIVRKVKDMPLDDKFREKHQTMASRKAYDYVVAGMRSAVTGGTCRAANRADYEVCGKTGTAQNRGRDHSIFMGFAPMNQPKIAVSVYVENGGFGADYGVPIGALIMEKYIKGKLSPESEKKAETFQKKHIYYGKAE